MRKLQVGDRVKCINPIHWLEKDKIYTVLFEFGAPSGFIGLINVGPMPRESTCNGFFQDRFEFVENPEDYEKMVREIVGL
jgi:hypothetical protein